MRDKTLEKGTRTHFSENGCGLVGLAEPKPVAAEGVNRGGVSRMCALTTPVLADALIAHAIYADRRKTGFDERRYQQYLSRTHTVTHREEGSQDDRSVREARRICKCCL